jgi:hypothetical protein
VSRLTQIISLFYHMNLDDMNALSAQLLESRKRTWFEALRAEARAYGCNQVPNAPSGSDLAELKAMSKEDALSITNTYNRDVDRQIDKLYDANRKGNRFYYAKQMEAWSERRRAWKQPSIVVTTETQTSEFARSRFRQMNIPAGRKYIFAGGAPTCKDCVSRFAAGVVDEAYIRKYSTPRHLNCPHYWRELRLSKLKCETLWLG